MVVSLTASRSVPPRTIRALLEKPYPQNPQGEVSVADLSFAIDGTSANSNTVQPLDENADQAAIIAKINELIAALRR